MNQKINFPLLARVIADILLLTGSVILAFTVRFVYAMAFEGGAGSSSALFATLAMTCLLNLLYLVPLCVLVFSFFGLYNRTRSYLWRAKALAVTKAVTVLYLLLPLIQFLTPEGQRTPRSVLFMAWGISLVCMVAARIWSTLWRKVIMEETPPAGLKLADEKHVLLIGGAGYIGSALIPKLLAAGYRVRLLDVFLFGKEPLGESVKHPNLEIVEADFRRVEKVVMAMRGVGSVIHLGGIVGDPACALDEQLTIEVNLAATRLIAEVAKGEGVKRVIFASTCSVYGANDSMLDENSALNPVSLYARSKIASERVLLAARSDGGLAPVILRFGTIFGLSGRTRFDLVVNLLTAKALFEGKITLYGGDQWRPFVHVDDAAQSVLTVLEAPLARVDGEVFNIGSNGMNYTLGQVGEIIKTLVPTAELLELGANSDRRNYRVDFAKVRRILGYETRWKLEEGINQVITAIRSGKITDYTLATYSNVKLFADEKTRNLARTDGWEREVLGSIAPFEPVTH